MEVIRLLKELEAYATRQSTNPYNNSGKERHVREIFADIAIRAARIREALEDFKPRHPDEPVPEQAAVTLAELLARVEKLEATVALDQPIPYSVRT